MANCQLLQAGIYNPLTIFTSPLAAIPSRGVMTFEIRCRTHSGLTQLFEGDAQLGRLPPRTTARCAPPRTRNNLARRSAIPSIVVPSIQIAGVIESLLTGARLSISRIAVSQRLTIIGS
jgi:hypothetical protein